MHPYTLSHDTLEKVGHSFEVGGKVHMIWNLLCIKIWKVRHVLVLSTFVLILCWSTFSCRCCKSSSVYLYQLFWKFLIICQSKTVLAQPDRMDTVSEHNFWHLSTDFQMCFGQDFVKKLKGYQYLCKMYMDKENYQRNTAVWMFCKIITRLIVFLFSFRVLPLCQHM